MKKYTQKDLDSMSGLDFAMDILQGERNKRENPYTPVSLKLDEARNELERFSEAKLTYSQLKAIFKAWEATKPSKHLAAYIVFTKDSWPGEQYTLTSCTYAVSSDNKAFQPNMGGYSIFGSCLDGSDRGVRLERYMEAETGEKDGWKVDYCLLLGHRM